MRDLPVLKGLESQVALQRLWEAVEDLLPEGQEPYSQPELIAEVCRLLKLESTAPPHMSVTERARVLGTLADSILHYGRESFDLASAKQRLGARGELPLTSYEIVFGQDATSLAATRTNIEEAIRKADHVLHLQQKSTASTTEAPFDALSMFAKQVRAKGEQFYLLVVALRKGPRLTVAEAWRAYERYVDCRDIQSPLELLRRFVDVYGMSFSLGPRSNLRFLVDDAIPLQPGEGFPRLDVSNPENHSFKASILARTSELAVAEVALGYVIDLMAYRTHLASVGVAVR